MEYKRFLILSVVFLQFDRIVCLQKSQSATPRPNVILLLADDLGYGDLGYSGHPTSYTPHLDDLAHNGRFFNNFYVTNPICSPSRASLLTGRYSSRSGVYPSVFTPDGFLGLPRNETTIAQLLKEQGYATQMVGKWHLGVGFHNEFLPTNFGFDDYLGIPYSHDMCPCETCFPDGGKCLISCWDFDVACPLYSRVKIQEQPANLPKLTDKFLDRSLNFIKQAHKDDNPFFLYHAFHQIHHPQFASSMFHGKSPRGPTGDALTEMDWIVGEILRTLTELQILDDTLIIFTSDNGPSMLRHELGGSAGLLRCGKGTTMEGGVRVPAIVYWKNHVTPGRTTALGSTLDILPTVAKVTGAEVPESLILDGIDFTDIMDNSSSPGKRKFLAVYPESATPEEGPYAVLYNQYKAHFYTLGSSLSDDSNFDMMCRKSHKLTRHDPPLLYDLFKDPGERYDIAEKDEYRNIMELITKWREHHMETMEWIPPRTQHVNKYSQPCCTNSHCMPFPTCCDCPKENTSVINTPEVVFG